MSVCAREEDEEMFQLQRETETVADTLTINHFLFVGVVDGSCSSGQRIPFEFLLDHRIRITVPFDSIHRLLQQYVVRAYHMLDEIAGRCVGLILFRHSIRIAADAVEVSIVDDLIVVVQFAEIFPHTARRLVGIVDIDLLDDVEIVPQLVPFEYFGGEDVFRLLVDGRRVLMLMVIRLLLLINIKRFDYVTVANPLRSHHHQLSI